MTKTFLYLSGFLRASGGTLGDNFTPRKDINKTRGLNYDFTVRFDHSH